MKLITAIAALALIAGSVDVEAQKRGDANKEPGGEGGKLQIGPLVHIAGGFFGELYPDERGELIDEAKGGDEEAQKALMADNMVAVEAVLEGLQEAETVKWIEFGMRIGAACTEEGMAQNLVQQKVQNAATKCLQHVQEQLEMQLQHYLQVTAK